MATWLNRLRATLDRFPDSFHHSAELFPRLDPQLWSEELRLAEQGHERGQENQPPATATEGDDVELTIRTRIEGLRKQAIDLAHERLSLYEERKARLGLLGRTEELWVAAADAGADFRATVQGDQARLFLRERDALDHHGHLGRFRARHRLDRPAQASGHRVLKLGVLGVVALVEIGLNLKFFADGSTLFLIGGAIELLLVTLINLSVAWFFGRVFLTRLLAGRWWQRLVALPFVLLWLVIVIGFNLAVGHYRELLAGAVPEQAAQLAWGRFLAAPLGIADFQSWILSLAGVVAAVIALVDGYAFDDPFPGYGWHSRENRRVLDELVADRQAFLDDLTTRKNEALDALRAANTDLEQRRESYTDITVGMSRLLAQYAACLDHLESCQQQLLATYRSANRRVRTEPEPAYFATLPVLIRPPIAVASGDAQQQRVEAETARATSALREAAEQVISEFDRAVAGLVHLRQILNEPGPQPSQELHRAA